jgi:hypothetical protein
MSKNFSISFVFWGYRFFLHTLKIPAFYMHISLKGQAVNHRGQFPDNPLIEGFVKVNDY